MGVIAFAGCVTMILALVVASAAGLIVRFRFPDRDWRNTSFKAFLIAYAVSFGPTFSILIAAFTVEQIGLNGAEADRVLALWDVPAGAASDLCYYRTPRFSQLADFRISEEDFLAWMKANQWKPQRYTTTDDDFHTYWAYPGGMESLPIEVWPVRGRKEADYRYVHDGYCYHERYSERAEDHLDIFYDVKSGRAYIAN